MHLRLQIFMWLDYFLEGLLSVHIRIFWFGKTEYPHFFCILPTRHVFVYITFDFRVCSWIVTNCTSFSILKRHCYYADSRIRIDQFAILVFFFWSNDIFMLSYAQMKLNRTLRLLNLSHRKNYVRLISRRVELVFLYLGGYFVLACYRFFLSGKPGIPTETLILNCNGNKTYEVELN